MPSNAQFLGFIVADELFVVSVQSGTITAGSVITGPDVAPDSIVTGAITSPAGGAGVYRISPPQTVSSALLTASVPATTVNSMSTIPASTKVQINPGVLSAGGAGIQLNGLFLTTDTRVPIGQVFSFPTATAVANFFGPATDKAAMAATYFSGYVNATQTPGAMLWAQYPASAVAAYLRSASLAGMTLAQLTALPVGAINVTMDGYPRLAPAVNLTAAVSFSAAASTIQTGLNASPTVQASFNGQVLNGTLSVGTLTSGLIQPGQSLSGTGVNNLIILTQLSGSVGGTGTYSLNGTATVAAEGMTSIPTPVVVTFDSVLSAFVISSGITGPLSTSAFATGTLAQSLSLTSTSGAILSQGAGAASPAAFMTTLAESTQNWALFTTAFNPDSPSTGPNIVAGSNAVKLAFAQWAGTTNFRFGYVPWDNDPTPQTVFSATSSLGALIVAQGLPAAPVWDSANGPTIAAFVLGTAAAINTAATNGRITFAYKSGQGLSPGVTDPTSEANLINNGYSFYEADATASQGFQFFWNGQMGSVWKWLDSYVNQIWMNSGFQAALMSLLTSVTSIPYNQAGYTQILNALLPQIQAALNFGAIRAGVAPSTSEASQANTQAGKNISTTLQNQGWYLQVLDPGATARGNRQTPIINFWYMDGEAIQLMTMSSVDIQ